MPNQQPPLPAPSWSAPLAVLCCAQSGSAGEQEDGTTLTLLTHAKGVTRWGEGRSKWVMEPCPSEPKSPGLQWHVS